MRNGRRADSEYATRPSASGGVSAARSAEQIRIEKEEQTVNTYYFGISKWYRAIKFLLLAIFVGYLIVMMCMYRSAITYDNLMYLIRDFETDVDVSSKGFEEINYNENEKMSFGIYKDRLGVATGTEFTLYNTTGAVELKYNHSMENPKVETGEKYALVYDIGGTSYSVFNTIARVSTKKSDFIIQGADISDSGAFSLITRSKENRYIISFYDSSFRELSRVYKDKYVTDVAIDGAGKKYAIVSCNVSSSDFIAEVMTGSVNSDECATFEIPSCLPLSVDFINEDTFVIVCDNSAIFVDSEGNMKTSCSYPDMKLTSAYVYGGRLVVTGSENVVGSTSKTVVYDSEGSIVDQFVYNAKISTAVLTDNYVFCLSGEEIIKRDSAGNITTVPCPAYTKTIVPYFDNVAVCTGTKVVMGFGGEKDGAEGAAASGSDDNTSDDSGEVSADETVNVDMEFIG